MAKNRNLIFTKSNYTKKNKHKTLRDGIIYEYDYMTSEHTGDWGYDGGMPYGESNFKIFKPDNYIDNGRKHKYGEWVKQNICDDNEVWTLNCVNHNDGKISTTESTLIINPKYKSFRDFAYFGSSSELLKTTVTDIIKEYPGEMYVTDAKVEMNGKEYAIVSNPFNIDIVSGVLSNNEMAKADYNPLRYFSQSFRDYNILDCVESDKSKCITTKWFKLEENFKPCYDEGDFIASIALSFNKAFIFDVYFINGEKTYYTDTKWIGYKVRPNERKIKQYFDNLEPFAKFLLNKDSNPRYTALLEYEEETETGYVLKESYFTWPTVYGWNLDIVSPKYTLYLNKLIEIAEYYDTKYTDNLWRMMVHDSIKNMDLTFSNPSLNEDIEDYRLGTSELHGLFLAIARQFDDIKGYIDNIKSLNKIEYDKNGNLPDYFLSDANEISGWECTNPTNGLVNNTTIKNLFPSLLKEYKLTDCNVDFYTNLKINSKDILKHKGTRHGIEMLLSLFGLTSYSYARKLYNSLPNSEKKNKNGEVISWENLSEVERRSMYDYKLDEYVSVISNTSDDIIPMYDEEGNIQNLPVEEYAKFIKYEYTDDFVYSNDKFYDKIMPVKIVTLVALDNDGNETYYKYMIPWAKKNDNNFYFQMKGGWGDINMKKISDDFYLKRDSDFKIYDETIKYLNTVMYLEDLIKMPFIRLTNDMIFYVKDISDVKNYFTDISTEGFSNFFILKDKTKSNIFGNGGWTPILERDIEGRTTKDALKVIYLESLIDNYKGNNPHVGYGSYDNGDTYLDYFKQLFKYYIEHDGFESEVYDCNTGEVNPEILKIGFNINEPLIDNDKTWFFTDTTKESKLHKLYKHYENLDNVNIEFNGKEYTGETALNIFYEYSQIVSNVYVGRMALNNGDCTFETNLSAFNLETQNDEDIDEASANSIINLKNLSLTFISKTQHDIYYDFITKSVLPYLKQMIPSTSILKIDIIEDNVTIKYMIDSSEKQKTKQPNATYTDCATMIVAGTVDNDIKANFTSK